MKSIAVLLALVASALCACTTNVPAPEAAAPLAPQGPVHAPSSPHTSVDAGPQPDAGDVDVTPEPPTHDASVVHAGRVVTLDPRVLTSPHFHVHPRDNGPSSSAHFHVHAH